MSRLLKLSLLFILLLSAAVPALLAQEAEPTYPAGSITGITAADGQFSTLAAALAYTNQQDRFAGGKFTLFAPTDAAFAKLGLTAANISDNFSKADLRDLLHYHVLRGRYSSADLKTMLGDTTMFNGAPAGLKFYEDDLYVNDEAKVVQANIPADNGYIHAVDSVILPPWPRDAAAAAVVVAEEPLAEETAVVAEEAAGAPEAIVIAGPAEGVIGGPAEEMAGAPANSIAGIAAADGRFNTVLAAAVAAGLADDLAGGEWTAFVPTDDAFAKLGVTADNVATTFSQEELAGLLLYHLLPGNNSTAQLKTKLGNVTMANGELAGLKYYDGDIYVNDEAKVIQANIVTDNGTIHVVDNVILPPWPRE